MMSMYANRVQVTYLQNSVIKTVEKVQSIQLSWIVGVDTEALVIEHHLVSCSLSWNCQNLSWDLTPI